MADYLLRTSGRGVHARNVSSDTMLHCALKATSCDPRMLKILIHHGADLAAVGADGLTVRAGPDAGRALGRLRARICACVRACVRLQASV